MLTAFLVLTVLAVGLDPPWRNEAVHGPDKSPCRIRIPPPSVAFTLDYARPRGWELRSSVLGCGLWPVHVIPQVLSDLNIRCPWSGVEDVLARCVPWLHPTSGIPTDMAHQVIAKSYFFRTAEQQKLNSVKNMAMLSAQKLPWEYGARSVPCCLIILTTG